MARQTPEGLFLVYDVTVDQLVPLTLERLDKLEEIAQAYGHLKASFENLLIAHDILYPTLEP